MSGLAEVSIGQLPKASDVNQIINAIQGQTDVGGPLGGYSPINAPSAAPTAALGAAGNINNTEWYGITFVTGYVSDTLTLVKAGETTLSPISSPITASSQQINLSGILTGPPGTAARNIYRSPAILNPSAALTLSSTSGSSSLIATTYYVANDFVNASGRTTIGSSQASIILPASGDNIVVTISLPVGATGTGIYVGTTTSPLLLGTVGSTGNITYSGGAVTGLSATVNGSTLTITISATATATGASPQSSNTANLGTYKLVATLTNNSATTYTDNTPDSSLGVLAPTENSTGTTLQFPIFSSIPGPGSWNIGEVVGVSTGSGNLQLYQYNGTEWTLTGASTFAQLSGTATNAQLQGPLLSGLTSPNSTLNISFSGGVSGATADINLSHANTWTGAQTFSGAVNLNGGATVASGETLQVNGSIAGINIVSQLTAGTGISVTNPSGYGSATVTVSNVPNSALTGNLVSSLSATNGLSVSNPTGVGAASYSIVLNGATLQNGASGLSVNLGNANSWQALQTFGAGATVPSGQVFTNNGSYAGSPIITSITAGTGISVTNPTSPGAAVVSLSGAPNSGLAGPLVSSLTSTNGLSASNPSGVGSASYSIVLADSSLSATSSGLSLNVGNANTFTALETFNAGISSQYVSVSGLTGATQASRYVGATAGGAPTSGTFAVGDYIIDRTGSVWICTTAGSPGTWTKASPSPATTTSLGTVEISVAPSSGPPVALTTSDTSIPRLNTTNTWSGGYTQTFSGTISAQKNVVASSYSGGNPANTGYAFSSDVNYQTGIFSPSRGVVEVWTENIKAFSIPTGGSPNVSFYVSASINGSVSVQGYASVYHMYNGVASSITTTQLSVPSGVTATVGTSGTVGSYLAASTTYNYTVTAIAMDSTETSVSSTASATEGATPYPITVSWSPVTYAKSYNVYKNGNLLMSTTSTNVTDSGNIATTSQVPPAFNQTGQVRVSGPFVLPVGVNAYATQTPA